VAFSFLIFEHLPPEPVMPFVGISRLMAEGIGYGGEADALGAAGVAVLHRLTGCSGFTEMFCPDWEGGEVLMSHMGEANPQFARSRPALVEKPSILESGSDSGVLLFESEPGPATLASLSTSPGGGFRWVVSEGELTSSPLYPALNAPHYRFRPRLALPDFLTAYSEAGGSHHLALCRGHMAFRIERLANAIGIEYRSV
jgi:L-arabinose isomerase